ncbi:twin-arginine translocation signal domain-containing protein [Pseudoalteromonas sp. SMS1]|uniref:twin-arginine translocation signal domain-containing protein n=1 Tax=Pseudoalteromonas sp. SMS1 TaxID=2908894 RepID=UPI001F393BE2|nr:twin-arginine translocation signal domain-containing protein [Pseudoalteromonas sp. SMS1]MCF2860202.1 twin-arginine translocation signal domain-containing protein [Pseudoalteromonas sp. SMS1]
MEPLNNKGLSRRSFLKGTGIGMGVLASSMPSFAFENVFDNHNGAVATAQLKNAGLLEQAQTNLLFKQLTDALNFKHSNAEKVLIVLGQVSDQAFPYSVDHKLLSACLTHLHTKGISRSHITVAYRAPSTLGDNAPLVKAIASTQSGSQLNNAPLVNVATSNAWSTINMPKALPSVKILEQAKSADHIIYLDQLTDQHGALHSPTMGLAKVVFDPQSFNQYRNQYDDLFSMGEIQNAISKKVRLLAYNASRFIAKSTETAVQPHHVHPGLLAISNDVTSHQLFAENYLHSVLNTTPALRHNAQQLTWFQSGVSRDPMTIEQIEKTIQRSGVALNKVQLV